MFCTVVEQGRAEPCEGGAETGGGMSGPRVGGRIAVGYVSCLVTNTNVINRDWMDQDSSGIARPQLKPAKV